MLHDPCMALNTCQHAVYAASGSQASHGSQHEETGTRKAEKAVQAALMSTLQSLTSSAKVGACTTLQTLQLCNFE